MDTNLIISIIGFSSLIVERLFKYMNKSRKSKCKSQCCGNVLEIDKETIEEKK